MTEHILLTFGSVVLVSLISLIGVAVLALKQARLRSVLLYLVSFAAGALIGDAFIHLLPEAAELGFTTDIALFGIAGIVIFFGIEKFIHWHHCHLPRHDKAHTRTFAYMNLIGDGVHNFVDGLIVAASYLASVPIGIATTIAVVLHEIPQEISDFAVLIHGGMSRTRALVMNFLSAILAIAGAVVGLFLITIEGTLPFMLAFAAGGFIYIAAADLIPELHKRPEFKTSVAQLFFFLLGIGVMYGLLLVE